jgi:hypothetical protein
MMLRRNVLKIGLLPLSSAAFPFASFAYPAGSPFKLQLLGKHRWLSAYARHSFVTEAAPPLANIPGVVRQSALLFWIGINLQLVKKYRLNPLRAARTFSYLTVALHDAVSSCQARFGANTEHCVIGIHFTAGRIVEYLFPEEVKGKWTGEGIALASRSVHSIRKDWEDLWRLADHIANGVIDLALTDGSARINALVQPPKNIDLVWKAAPPLWSSRPVEPGAPDWRPWLVPSSVGQKCPPPVTLSPKKYADEIRLVYEVHGNLTADQKKIAEDWNLDLGTITPPGVWLKKTVENASFGKLALIEQTGILSLLTTTMLDAFSACWQVKFTWWTERPITAIRRLYDPEFLPHVLTPSFPSYTSGHAAVSGAAATLLANLLPQHNEDWQHAAQEAADSRLYGGIHFKFDNDEGLALGRKVASLALARIVELAG